MKGLVVVCALATPHNTKSRADAVTGIEQSENLEDMPPTVETSTLVAKIRKGVMGPFRIEARSRRRPVVVEQSAESVASLHPAVSVPRVRRSLDQHVPEAGSCRGATRPA